MVDDTQREQQHPKGHPMTLQETLMTPQEMVSDLLSESHHYLQKELGCLNGHSQSLGT